MRAGAAEPASAPLAPSLQILSYIDIGKREGARLLTGGRQKGTKGYYVSEGGLAARAACLGALQQAAWCAVHHVGVTPVEALHCAAGSPVMAGAVQLQDWPAAPCTSLSPGCLVCSATQIEPTVFADVKDSMRIAKEEIFGPGELPPLPPVLQCAAAAAFLSRCAATAIAAAGTACVAAALKGGAIAAAAAYDAAASPAASVLQLPVLGLLPLPACVCCTHCRRRRHCCCCCCDPSQGTHI